MAFGYQTSIQWITTLTLILLTGRTQAAIGVSGINDSILGSWDGYFKCAFGIEDRATCFSGQHKEHDMNKFKRTSTAEIVLNNTYCEEIDINWLDEHPLVGLTDYGYAIKQIWDNGLIRYEGKVGGRDAAPDAKPHPLWTFYKNNGITYNEHVCRMVREFRRFWWGVASTRQNATNPMGIEYNRLFDFLYEQEQQDEVASYENWVNCISGESSEDTHARYMPLGRKYLGMIKTPRVKRHATLMYMSTGRTTITPVLPIEMFFFDAHLVQLGFFSYGAMVKRLMYDFRALCIGSSAFVYPHKADLETAFDQFALDYYAFWEQEIASVWQYMETEYIAWGTWTMDSANRRDTVHERYHNGCESEGGCNPWYPKAYHNHTDHHLYGRYNDTTGLLMVNLPWHDLSSSSGDRWPDGSIRGEATYVHLTGPYITLKEIDFSMFPKTGAITRDYRQYKNSSVLGASLIDLAQASGAHNIFSPLVASFVSVSMTEAESMELIRNMPWNQDSPYCRPHVGNFTTWLEYKQHVLFLGKLHAYVQSPTMPHYGGEQQDCRYVPFIRAMLDPSSYVAAGLTNEEAIVWVISHILIDETCHALAYLYFRILSIITGQDFIDMLVTIWNFMMSLVFLRIAFFYVKITPARIGRMIDNRDRYAASFKFMREHRSAFLSKSKKMGEKYLTETLGLKMRRALRHANTDSQTEAMKKAFTFEEGTAHFIHPTNYFLMDPYQISNNRAIRKSRKPTKDPTEYVHLEMSTSMNLILGFFTAVGIALLGIFSAFMIGLVTW